MDIQTKDGILLQGIPEGTPDEAIKARIERIRGLGKEGATKNPPPPMFHPSGEKDLSYSNPEMLAAHPLTRFATGSAAPFLGAAQLGANVAGAGDPVNEYLARSNQMTQQGRGELGSQGFDWWNAAGQAASPAYLKALAIPNAATTTGRIGQGAMIGGAAGATAPVNDPENYWATKAAQTAGGATIGSLVPGAWEGAKAIGRGSRNIAQPYLGQWGADQASGRLANLAAGDLAPQVREALSIPQTLVPGSSPTAGQAVAGTNSAEFAALQQLAAERAPSVYSGPSGIEGKQKAAQIAALRTVGQDETALNAAKAARAKESGPLYEAARTYSEYIAPPNTTAIKTKTDLILSQNPGNRELVTELTNVRKGLDAAGNDPQKVSSIIDGLKTSIANKDNSFIRGQLTELKNDLEKALPGYEAAQTKFAEMSKPVNQMQIGQYVEGKLVPALSEDAKLRAAAYAQTMRDAHGTIKRATGAPRYDELSQVMTPTQMETLGAVHKDLARDALIKELARKGTAAASERIGQAIPELPATGMFSPKISVTRAIYNRLTGQATEKIMNDLAMKMQNPQEMARIMKNATPFERQKMIDAMMRYQATVEPTAATQGAQ